MKIGIEVYGYIRLVLDLEWREKYYLIYSIDDFKICVSDLWVGVVWYFCVKGFFNFYLNL